MTSKPPMREKWSELKLKHTSAQRKKIMACIRRLNDHESCVIGRAVIRQGGQSLPLPHTRAQIREWFRARWTYLLSEYEAILPHVDELPDEKVKGIVRSYLMGADCADPRD